MFALVILERVLLFDYTSQYGMFELNEVNFNGYKILTNYKEIITYYHENYFKEKELKNIEQYSVYLHRICLKYLESL